MTSILSIEEIAQYSGFVDESQERVVDAKAPGGEDVSSPILHYIQCGLGLGDSTQANAGLGPQVVGERSQSFVQFMDPIAEEIRSKSSKVRIDMGTPSDSPATWNRVLQGGNRVIDLID